MWLAAANSNDDGLQPRSSTATLCMRKADRSSTSHTTNSFWRVCGERKQPVIKGVLLSVARVPEGRRIHREQLNIDTAQIRIPPHAA